jgi:hypothetical protein
VHTVHVLIQITVSTLSLLYSMSVSTLAFANFPIYIMLEGQLVLERMLLSCSCLLILEKLNVIYILYACDNILTTHVLYVTVSRVTRPRTQQRSEQAQDYSLQTGIRMLL